MTQSKTDWVHRNVMEVLVSEEIERQINRCPENIKQHINRLEVATYALNRLPALYASSQQGFNKQKIKGRSEYSAQVTKAVRQGFAAVQKDLLRYSTPLISEQDQHMEAASNALAELSEFLPRGEVNWVNIVKLVKPILKERAQKYKQQKSARKMQARPSDMWKSSEYKK